MTSRTPWLTGMAHAALKLFLLLSAFLITSVTHAQRNLSLKQLKMISYDKGERAWEKWPADWTVYKVDNRPIMRVTSLDEAGKKFQIEFVIEGESYSFDVTFVQYDAKNKWYKYSDKDGSSISVVGSTLSSLYADGWPDTKTTIYFWIKSETAFMFQ